MNLVVRDLGHAEYESTWEAMQRFTEGRGETTADEVWILEHPPVYTLGLNGKPEHILNPGSVPVIQSDRGGQVTYHGPGQLILYALIDLKRRSLGVRALVSALEIATIDTLRQYGITAHARPEAPGVYVEEAKIASVGIRIRRGCSYHGLSLNVAMDLAPFRGINPCGYPDLQVTSLADLGGPDRPREVAVPLIAGLTEILGYSGMVTPGAVV